MKSEQVNSHCDFGLTQQKGCKTSEELIHSSGEPAYPVNYYGVELT